MGKLGCDEQGAGMGSEGQTEEEKWKHSRNYENR